MKISLQWMMKNECSNWLPREGQLRIAFQKYGSVTVEMSKVLTSIGPTHVIQIMDLYLREVSMMFDGSMVDSHWYVLRIYLSF